MCVCRRAFDVISAPVVYTHLFHGEIYDATQESDDGAAHTAGGADVAALQPFQPLTPWDTARYPIGPLTPHTFPSIRPSEAPVMPVAGWVPPPNPSAGGAFSVVIDFGQNYAGACELQVDGDIAPLKGEHLNLRYGEQLLDGEDGQQDLFHPWWPCGGFSAGAAATPRADSSKRTDYDYADEDGLDQTPFILRTRDSPTQGDHNCANQTDRYILRGSPGAVGFVAALGKVPMQTNYGHDHDFGRTRGKGGGNADATRQFLAEHMPPKTAEVYTPSHAIKGGRWVQLNGTALNKSTVRFAGFAGGSGGSATTDMCAPQAAQGTGNSGAAHAGHLVPCSSPRTGSDVIITVKMWPLHSDVAIRGKARLFEKESEGNPPESDRRREEHRPHAQRVVGLWQKSSDVDSSSSPASPNPTERAHAGSRGWSVANVNALQTSIVRTHLNNLHSVPQDCPHREQRGWGGDAQLTSGSAAVNFDMAAFYTNWVTSMQDLQTSPDGNGDMPSYVPRAPGRGDKAPTWAAVAAVIPWEFWTRTGDNSMVALGYNTTKRLIDFWQQHLDPTTGLVDIVVYGDWNPSVRGGPNHDWGEHANQPQMMSAHGTYIEGLLRGVDIANAANEPQAARAWADAAAKARRAFKNVWWNETAGCFAQTCACQTAQAVAVAFNTTTTQENHAAAVAALVKSVALWNTTFIVGQGDAHRSTYLNGLDDTDGVFRPPQEGGANRSASVLSRHHPAAGFMLTYPPH